MEGREEGRMEGREREKERLWPLPHRQTAINKSIGNCGWLESNSGWGRGERDQSQTAPRWMGQRRRGEEAGKGREEGRRREI